MHGVPRSSVSLFLLAALGLTTLASPRRESAIDGELDFARDVRPILSDNCYFCHGPDGAVRKAGLRLDLRDEAFGELPSGAHAVVPGAPGESELLARISAEHEDDRMPPVDSGKSLAPEQIETLERWIAEGAQWEQHWSFIPPVRPQAPAVERADWPTNPIDSFVLARMEREGLSPSGDTARETLLRRVTFDLTGLPPTTDELDAFLADQAPGAYERVVERLLASPRYGEHMARYWLDAARYGDTHGLHLDNERSMWRYREWVIEALNRNLAFDEFTIEQLAGDLLPEPSLDQLIASGFNRCNVTSAEGGMIAAEYLALYAMDRVDTTSTIWMGLTVGCAKCHDHKYDPLNQKEYYELFAFFNNLTEEASDRNIANPAPFIRAPDPEQEVELERRRAAEAALVEQVEAPLPEVDAAQASWESEWGEVLDDRWRILVPARVRARHGTTLSVLGDDSVLATGANPDSETIELRAFAGESAITAVRLEALVPDGNPESVPGRAPNQNFVLTEFEVDAFPLGRPEEAERVLFVAASATHSQKEYPIDKAIDGKPGTGWGGLGAKGARSAVFIAAEPFGYPGGTSLKIRLKHRSIFKQHTIGRVRVAVSEDRALSYSRLGNWSRLGPFKEDDGRGTFEKEYGPELGVDLAAACGPEALKWREEPDLTDGEVHLFDQDVGSMYLFRTIDTPTARHMNVGIGSDDGVRIWVNGELVHDNPAARGVALDQDFVQLPLEEGRNEVLMKIVNYGGGFGFAFRRADEEAGGLPIPVATALATDANKRKPIDAALVRSHFRSRHSPVWKELDEELRAVRGETKAFEAALPTTMISREREERRPAYVLTRGQYDQPGEEVLPDVPGVLPPLPESEPASRNRLDLAGWLVSGDHPLTARVTVNRYWQRFFGTGLVKTAEDFGSQGSYPSHAELLDWLATEFVASGWDVKHMHRTLVTSHTYRQSARTTPELLERDPYNRLYARGPRFRLDAEQIRDTALFLGELLVERIGGMSVRPYQPDGVWFAVGYTSSNTARYKRDDGDALYRRSLYTFWKRTAAPPSMLTFDAPSRESCTVRRARTNTPLQALVLLNDPQYVEAARGFARRMLADGGTSDAERVSYGFRLATSRSPSERETTVLLAALAAQREAFRASPEGANELLEVGESGPGDTPDPVELAAWAEVATLILNLDETITRG